MTIVVLCSTELLNSALKYSTSDMDCKFVLFLLIRNACTACTGVRIDMPFVNTF